MKSEKYFSSDSRKWFFNASQDRLLLFKKASRRPTARVRRPHSL